MAWTERYVSHHASASDSNGGTDDTADAWATHGHAWATVGGSTRINLKTDGTHNVTTETGTPAGSASAVITQGYDSTAGDGGVADVDCGGAIWLNNTAADNISLRDLKITDWGSGNVVDIDNQCLFINVWFEGLNTGLGPSIDSSGLFLNCYFENLAGPATVGGDIFWCLADCDSGTHYLFSGNACVGCKAICRATGLGGFSLTGNDGASNTNCSAYNTTAGTSCGFEIPSGGQNNALINTYAEGFSGTGGYSHKINNAADNVTEASNKYFNCSNSDLVTNGSYNDLGNNGSVGSSGFTSAGTGDFSPTSVLRGLGWPPDLWQNATALNLNVGPFQNAFSSGGGGGTKLAGFGGGMIG